MRVVFGLMAFIAILAVVQAQLPCTLKLTTLGQTHRTSQKTLISNVGATAVGFNTVGSLAQLNDLAYGSSVSISNLATSGQVGYTWATPVEIAEIGWSANNVLNNAPQAQWEGLFQVQVTSAALNGNWETLAEVRYNSDVDPAGNYRHVYRIDCTGNTVAINRLSAATGIRLVTPPGSAFDELEVYSSVTPMVSGQNAGAAAGSVQTGGTFLPGNLASSATVNSAPLVNGFYGDPVVLPTLSTINHAGAVLRFAAPTSVSLVAFGRDNGGFFTDGQGTYVIQTTTNDAGTTPDGAITGWVTVGVIHNFGESALPSPALRHLFEFVQPDNSRALTLVRGIRILVPFTGRSALDEIEAYFTAVSSAPTLFTGAIAANATFSSGVPSPGGSVSNTGAALAVPAGVYVSSPGVVFLPNPAQIAAGNTTGTFLTQCSTIGPITVSFGTPASPALYGTAVSYCYGTLRYSVPPAARILRGTTFSVELELVPPPLQPIEFVVRTTSRLLVPTTDRAYFGIGQTRTTVAFAIDRNSPVGDVQLEFRSRSVRSYLPLISSVRVIGQIQTSLDPQARRALRITARESITLVPPLTPQLAIDNAGNVRNLFSVELTANATWAQVTPQFVPFVSGQEKGDFTLYPTALGIFNLTISSPFHETRFVTVEVLGSIFAGLPDTVYIGRNEEFELSLQPTPVTPIAPTITATNGLRITGNNTISGTNPLRLLTIAASSATFPGPATITISAPGYLTLALTIQVTNRPACVTGFALAADDTTCAPCSVNLAGSVCSGSPCLPSTFDFTLVRCSCPPGIAGRACEYERDFRYEIGTFNLNGTLISSTPSPGDSRAIVSFFRVPKDLLPNANDPLRGGRGQIILEPPSVSNTFFSSLPWVDITKVPFPLEASTSFVIPPLNFARGFVMDILSQDNTPVNVLAKPVEVFYYPDIRVSRDFRQLALYFWDAPIGRASAGKWIPAQNTCTPPSPPEYNKINSPIDTDANFGNYYVKICRTGQYAFFLRSILVSGVPAPEVVPRPLPPPSFATATPPKTADVKAGTTGQTGIQAPVPPKPDFPEQDALFDPEPLRLPLPVSSYNAASSLTITLAMTLVVLCVAVALQL